MTETQTSRSHHSDRSTAQLSISDPSALVGRYVCPKCGSFYLTTFIESPARFEDEGDLLRCFTCGALTFMADLYYEALN